MPRLKCTYAEFIEIIRGHGFSCVRHGGTSHQIWEGEVNGELRVVTVSPHQISADVRVGTLKAMIRQSGLNQKLFRK